MAAAEREIERDCAGCGQENALVFYADYEWDPEVGLFGWGADLETIRCLCKYTDAMRRKATDDLLARLQAGDYDPEPIGDW